MGVVVVDFTNFIEPNGRGVSSKCFILLAVFSKHKTSLAPIKVNFHRTN